LYLSKRLPRTYTKVVGARITHTQPLCAEISAAVVRHAASKSSPTVTKTTAINGLVGVCWIPFPSYSAGTVLALSKHIVATSAAATAANYTPKVTN
jgi:hypothetical protein